MWTGSGSDNWFTTPGRKGGGGWGRGGGGGGGVEGCTYNKATESVRSVSVNAIRDRFCLVERPVFVGARTMALLTPGISFITIMVLLVMIVVLSIALHRPVFRSWRSRKRSALLCCYSDQY